uniref:Uncharacterized protein n=1 Tax=Arundo donax TaxID=35708 RepID=A0A0A8Y704_ARUDO
MWAAKAAKIGNRWGGRKW